MKKELFIEHVKERGVKIIISNDVKFDQYMLNIFKRLKGFTKFIDFDCNINADGGCKEIAHSTRCCCSNCYANGGFFRIMIDRDVSNYARKFTKKGFWRKGKGCTLKHNMRSTTCLTTHCNHHPKESFELGMMYYRDKLHDIREKI